MFSDFHLRIRRRSWTAHSSLLLMGKIETYLSCLRCGSYLRCIIALLDSCTIAYAALLRQLVPRRNRVRLCSLHQWALSNKYWIFHFWILVSALTFHKVRIDWRVLEYIPMLWHWHLSKNGICPPHDKGSRPCGSMLSCLFPLLIGESAEKKV